MKHLHIHRTEGGQDRAHAHPFEPMHPSEPMHQLGRLSGPRYYLDGADVTDDVRIVRRDSERICLNCGWLIHSKADRLPDYEAAVDALDRIRQKMSDWQDETQKAGVYNATAPDTLMAKWVHDEAADALRRLRDPA